MLGSHNYYRGVHCTDELPTRAKQWHVCMWLSAVPFKLAWHIFFKLAWHILFKIAWHILFKLSWHILFKLAWNILFKLAWCIHMHDTQRPSLNEPQPRATSWMVTLCVMYIDVYAYMYTCHPCTQSCSCRSTTWCACLTVAPWFIWPKYMSLTYHVYSRVI